MIFKRLASAFSAAPQLTPVDVATAAQQGFRSLISNRPDGEEPGQPTAREMALLAGQHGLAFVHIPVVSGGVTDADVAAMKRALTDLPKPVLGFCRSGTRTAMLWALSEADRTDADTILKAAKAAGYDLGALKPALKRRAQGTKP